jgi:hypothetical protein
MGKMNKGLSVWVLALFAIACGGGGEDGTDLPPDSSSNVSANGLGETAFLTFHFTVQVSDSVSSAVPPRLTFPATYVAPFHVKPNGDVSLVAKEFPPMVLRICPTGLLDSFCATYVDDDRVGDGLDLVMDLCKVGLPHSNCGEDASIFKGRLTPDGSLFINGIDVRVRVFLLVGDGSGPTGKTARESDGGFIADMPRLTVKVHTDRAASGKLSADGQKVEDKHVRLVSAGIIPENMPEIGLANYLGIIEGNFTVDPLDWLD